MTLTARDYNSPSPSTDLVASGFRALSKDVRVFRYKYIVCSRLCKLHSGCAFILPTRERAVASRKKSHGFAKRSFFF